MRSSLIVARSVYAPGIPDAQAVLISDGVIAWIGDRSTAQQYRGDVANFLDFEDAFVAPGFVDAHVHLSATGLNLLGFNASSATSFLELAVLVNRKVLEQPTDHIYMQGWDDTNWVDDISAFISTLSVQALDRSFYLSRVDGHSAIANGPWLEGKPQVVSGRVRESIWNDISQSSSRELIENCVKAALHTAASNGVVAVHENGGPTVSSELDFAIVKSHSDDENQPRIHAYWADLNLEHVLELAADGAAGDLSIDGSIGSRSAKLFESYADADGITGNAYLDVEQIAEHILGTSRLGIQAGFHAIGDEACARVHAGFALALKKISRTEIRASRHRIEHLSMPSLESLQLYADLGVVASVQPSFDQAWGVPGGMYESRLGTRRLLKAHPFAEMIKNGMVLAFGSDAPVTDIKPWNWIRSATQHNQSNQRISLRSAFHAATRGGHRAARNDDSGVIAVGAPADLAVWNVKKFSEVQSNDTASTWSTDPRSGTHALPDLSFGDPQCLLTLRNGRALFDASGLLDV